MWKNSKKFWEKNDYRQCMLKLNVHVKLNECKQNVFLVCKIDLYREMGELERFPKNMKSHDIWTFLVHCLLLSLQPSFDSLLNQMRSMRGKERNLKDEFPKHFLYSVPQTAFPVFPWRLFGILILWKTPVVG